MPTLPRHLSLAAAVLAAAACAFTASTARAAAVCGEGTYSYAGFSGRTVVNGVSATIAQAGPLVVHAGHVAGWIGVVDSKSDGGWLQAGLSALPGQVTSAIYVEYRTPGHAPVYRELGTSVATGEPHTFTIVEQAFRPGSWVVWVDGRLAGAPFHLPGSHHRWTAQVLGESWAGQTGGVCNAYSYAFSNVRLVHRRNRSTGLGGGLTADPHYAVADPSPSGFVATSFGVARQPPQRNRPQ